MILLYSLSVRESNSPEGPDIHLHGHVRALAEVRVLVVILLGLGDTFGVSGEPRLTQFSGLME